MKSSPQLAFLQSLADSFADASDAEEIFAALEQHLKTRTDGFVFALGYLFDDGLRAAHLACHHGLPGAEEAAPSVIHLASAAPIWPADRLGAFSAETLDTSLPRWLQTYFAGRHTHSPGQTLIARIAGPDQSRPAGFLVAGMPLNSLTADDAAGFVRLVANQIAAALAGLRESGGPALPREARGEPKAAGPDNIIVAPFMRNGAETAGAAAAAHPVSASQPQSAGAEPPEARPARLRILLVEDHKPTRNVLASLLRRRDYEVEAAASASEAREMAGRKSFQVLISDLGLPDGNGFDLMAEFRARFAMKGIALTGYGMERDVKRGEEAGFAAYLVKPIRIQSLDQALARVAPQI